MLSIEADLAGPWEAEVQLDAGPPASDGERLLVKDALLRYTGFEARGVTIAIGNQKVPFSQSGLQSASRRSLVERPFTGSSEFGAPGRSIALSAGGVGMNWYINGHALKFSVLHRKSFHDRGIRNVRSRATYLQSHFAF